MEKGHYPQKPSYYYTLNLKEPRKSIVVQSDVCVYGATSSGVTAALQAASLGHKVAVVEFSRFVGGMTASGLGATDTGNRHVIGGLARQFYKDVGEHYGSAEQWFFEPHIALSVYNKWLEHKNISVFLEHRLAKVEKIGQKIVSFTTEDGIEFKAQIFIDATYEGDLMAKAGVSYAVGREDNDVYDEHYNGVQYGHPHHNFIRFVDPYKRPGDPKSGLLYGISDAKAGVHGQGDSLIQAYNFRMCLTRENANMIPFFEPHNYSPEKYELLLRYIKAGMFDIFDLNRPLPNGKTDHNNWGAFNTDHIGANYGWPTGDYETRERIYQDHISYQAGLFYFLAADKRLPERVRKFSSQWGLAADEFTQSSNWPPQLYVREGRRMISDYVITEHDTLGRYTLEDSVGMASYKMDSHNCKRVVKAGRVMNEGNVEVAPLDPIPIPYRSIRPKRSECTNLLVPVCVSASHIAYGSIRMEPVFMITGQSAGVAAHMALKGDGAVQNISYSDFERKLRGEGQILAVGKDILYE
ncbi:MAG: FAD-dependent oxidoreductase [Chitinispirillia bacterium]|nr:FAD-dependent oxidoreductase [Chitinispirillia bacterium]